MFNLLLEVSPNVSKVFLIAEQKKSIQSHMNYFQRLLRPKTAQLIQIVVLHRLEGKKKS